MNELRAKFILDLTGNIDRRSRDFSRDIRRMSRDSVDSVGRLRNEIGHLDSLGSRVFRAAGRGALALNKRVAGLGNRYTALAAGAAAVAADVQSARLDKRLKLVQQTAGASAGQVAVLRNELFRLAREDAQNPDSLLDSFENAIAAGQGWSQALATMKAIGPAMGVTAAGGDALAAALTVASNAFQFDLSKPREATNILDRMTVAGRLGNAELEDLSSIFGRVGVNAKAANLGFSQTLAMIEELSKSERDPSRLATLTESTLRLFTNNTYLKNASKAYRIPFYDKSGAARPAFDVLKDISKIYNSLHNDAQRARFISAGFGHADLDTQRGMRILLSGNALGDIDRMTKQIEGAPGTIARDLPDALNNAVDQANRLKNTMREAADAFSQPVNATLTRAIDTALKLANEAGITPKAVLGTGAGIATAGVAGAKVIEKLALIRGQTKALPLYVQEVVPTDRRLGGPGGGRSGFGGRKLGVIGQSIGAGLAGGAASIIWGIIKDDVSYEYKKATGDPALKKKELDQLKNYSLGNYYRDLFHEWFGGSNADAAAKNAQARRAREGQVGDGGDVGKAFTDQLVRRHLDAATRSQVDLRVHLDHGLKADSVDVLGPGIGRVDVGDTQGPQVRP